MPCFLFWSDRIRGLIRQSLDKERASRAPFCSFAMGRGTEGPSSTELRERQGCAQFAVNAVLPGNDGLPSECTTPSGSQSSWRMVLVYMDNKEANTREVYVSLLLQNHAQRLGHLSKVLSWLANFAARCCADERCARVATVSQAKSAAPPSGGSRSGLPGRGWTPGNVQFARILAVRKALRCIGISGWRRGRLGQLSQAGNGRSPTFARPAITHCANDTAEGRVALDSLPLHVACGWGQSKPWS